MTIDMSGASLLVAVVGTMLVVMMAVWLAIALWGAGWLMRDRAAVGVKTRRKTRVKRHYRVDAPDGPAPSAVGPLTKESLADLVRKRKEELAGKGAQSGIT